MDDDANALFARKVVLESAGYTLLTAENFQHALELFGLHNIDLVVSDHLTPGGTGAELAKALKLARPKIPIILLSGVVERPQGVEYADVFFSKGEGPLQLLKTVASLLAKAAYPDSPADRATVRDHVCHFTKGDHVCFVYDSKAQQMAAIVPWIQQGLKREERCKYIADDNTVPDIKQELAAAGVNVERECRRGALAFVTKQETYLQDGRFQPQAMLDLLGSEMKAALDAGFSGLRATGEMIWALGPEPGCDRLAEYESLLDDFVDDTKVTLLCQYARPRFPASTLNDVLGVHRLSLTKFNSLRNHWNLRIRRKEFFAEVFAGETHPRYQFSIQRDGSRDILSLGWESTLAEAEKRAEAALQKVMLNS